VLVNQARHERTLVVLPDQLVTDWAASSFEPSRPTTWRHCCRWMRKSSCWARARGSGSRGPRSGAADSRRVGYEIMDVQAACRTFNILVSEERKVAAALLLG